MATNFTTRYKKDLSTQALKTKLARRKSLLQKESRHKEFNRGRQFGPIDVNTQASRDRELSRLDETGEVHSPKSSAKPSRIPNATAKAREQERFQMLQRYKAEKELRKLKEQREKPIFKCGRFKPEDPSFLPKGSQIPVLNRAKETATKASCTVNFLLFLQKMAVQVLLNNRRGILKCLLDFSFQRAPNYVSKDVSQAAQLKQVYVDKPLQREKKEVQQPASTLSNGRVTRAAAAAAAKSKIPQMSWSAVTMENTPAPPTKEVTSPASVATEPQGAFLAEGKNLPGSHAPAPAPSRRERSFAPQNFVFQPLEGLATYRVKPMSPSKANVFLSPNLIWSPVKNTSEVPGAGATECGPKDWSLKDQTSPHPEGTKEEPQGNPSGLEWLAPEEECVPREKFNAGALESQPRVKQELLPEVETANSTGEPPHDVPYFRKTLQSETQRLASHCEEWDGTAETDIPEDAKDLVRTTVGQTRLLVAERFKQFEGLVDNCEFGRGEKETTCADLDGFWDMVNFQIEDVNKKFENLKTLRANGWHAVDDVQSRKPCKKKAPPPPRATKAKGGSAERRAARKRLATIKAAVKARMKQEGPVAEATPEERPPAAETLVFDGGFFQIESPAKPLPSWTPRSSNRLSRRATPRSTTKALLQSCADTCVVRHGAPTPSKPVPPLPDVDASFPRFPGEVCVPAAGTEGSCPDPAHWKAANEPPPPPPPRRDGGGCNVQRLVTAEEARGWGGRRNRRRRGPCACAGGQRSAGMGNNRSGSGSWQRHQLTSVADACDSGSSSALMDSLGSVSFQGLGSPSVIRQVPEMTAEVENIVGDVVTENILCSPEKESQVEGVSPWSEEQHPSEGPLLEDFSSDIPCENRDTDSQTNPDGSFFFTPLRSKAENRVAALACDDLIVFSPVPLPEGGNNGMD
ncbi:hypothetical protein JRQ81_001317 [Phrynocephalus forsythii]|uniref:DLG associated protein 5 n=1 Tax=Phrynocephalus forsythii TaxID=171643 RepID=A0A9Q0Y7L2_9SAUR|nr:hypothetical protein JRQ81_001317 [Phrynocephalus forsythii]